MLRVLEKGKPVERRGRKAMGPDQSRDRQAAEITRHTKEKVSMKQFIHRVRQFLVSEDGPTAVEYAVMLALIVIVALTSIQLVGTRTSATFNSIATPMPSS